MTPGRVGRIDDERSLSNLFRSCCFHSFSGIRSCFNNYCGGNVESGSKYEVIAVKGSTMR